MQSSVLSRLNLDGRCAMVTGAGAGLGAGIATGLAEAGANIVLVGRTQAPLWMRPRPQVRAHRGREAVIGPAPLLIVRQSEPQSRSTA